MELTIDNLIKIIIGVTVVVLVVSALYFFGGNVADFFRNLPGGSGVQ